MTIVEKLGMGIIAVAGLTAVSLPDRKFAQVVDAFARLFRGSLSTAITGKA